MINEKLTTNSSKKSNANNTSLRVSQGINTKVLLNNKSSLKQKHTATNPPGHKKFNSSNKMPSLLDFPVPPYCNENIKPIVTHDFAHITAKNLNKPQHQYVSSKQIRDKQEKKEESTSKSPIRKNINKNERSFQTTTEDKTPRSIYNQNNSSNVSGNLLKFNNSPNNKVNRLPNKRGTDKSENRSDISNISNNYNNKTYNNHSNYNNNYNNNFKGDFSMNTLLEIKNNHCKKKLSDHRVDKIITNLPKKINNSKNSFQRLSNNFNGHNQSNINNINNLAVSNSSVSENTSNASPKLNPNLINNNNSVNMQGLLDDRKFSIIDIPYNNQIVEEKKFHRVSRDFSSINNSSLSLLKTANLKSLFILVSNK